MMGSPVILCLLGLGAAIVAGTAIWLLRARARRARRTILLNEFDFELYGEAQRLPSDPHARPTPPQRAFARLLGLRLGEHLTAWQALDAIDDAVADLHLTWRDG